MTTNDQKQAVETASSKPEKASWKRKQKNIDKLHVELEELEDKIFELMAEKIKLIDRITTTRGVMVNECIHPHDMLVGQDDDSILCKFCNKSLGVVKRP